MAPPAVCERRLSWALPAWEKRRKRGLSGPARLQRAVLAPLFGVPFGTWPAHIMKLGPIGVACHLDQPLPADDDGVEATAERCGRGNQRDQHGAAVFNAICRERKRRAPRKSPRRNRRWHGGSSRASLRKRGP